MLDTNIPMRMKNFFSVIQRTYQRQSASSNKGVAILLTVLIMSVILAIGLGLSVILIQQTKMMAGIGNSVISFFAAESGIEKVLFYDYQKIPLEGARGLCDICNQCAAQECKECQTTGTDCGPTSCKNCTITFHTDIDAKKSYDITATVETIDTASTATIKSIGSYREIKRAIKIKY